MKCRVSGKDFFEAVKRVRKTVAKNPCVKALLCAKLELRDYKLSIQTVNLEYEFAIFTSFVECETAKEEGIRLVKCEDLYKCADSMKKLASVELEGDGNMLHLTGDCMQFALPCYDLTEFPYTNVELEPVGTMGFIRAKHALQSVCTVIDEDKWKGSNGRDKFCGAEICLKDNAITMQSTDSCRFVICEFPAKCKDTGTRIIRGRFLQSFLDSLPKKGLDEIRLFARGESFGMEWDGFRVIAKAIPGEMPDFRRVIPRPEWSCELNQVDVAKQAEFVFKNTPKEKKSTPVIAKMNLAGDCLTIRTDCVGKTVYAGKNEKTAFRSIDARFLMEMMDAVSFQTSVCTLYGTDDEGRPIACEAHSLGMDITCVLMPCIQ